MIARRRRQSPFLPRSILFFPFLFRVPLFFFSPFSGRKKNLCFHKRLSCRWRRRRQSPRQAKGQGEKKRNSGAFLERGGKESVSQKYRRWWREGKKRGKFMLHIFFSIPSITERREEKKRKEMGGRRRLPTRFSLCGARSLRPKKGGKGRERKKKQGKGVSEKPPPPPSFIRQPAILLSISGGGGNFFPSSSSCALVCLARLGAQVLQQKGSRGGGKGSRRHSKEEKFCSPFPCPTFSDKKSNPRRAGRSPRFGGRRVSVQLSYT